MCGRIVYLKSYKRRPVRLSVPIGPRDLQQDPPDHWCARCGSEIYGRSCPACGEVRKYERRK